MISIESYGGLLPMRDSPSPINSEESSYPGAELFDDLLGESMHESLHEDEDASKPKAKARGASTAERRATHNAVERARRETLNGRFMDLAAVLPNMKSVKRPSKSAIVNKSIEYARSSQAREAALVAQNDALRVEVNELRARLGMGPLTTTPASVSVLPARARQPSIGSQSSAKASSVAADTASPLSSADASPKSTFEFMGSPMQPSSASVVFAPPMLPATAAGGMVLNVLGQPDRNASFNTGLPQTASPADLQAKKPASVLPAAALNHASPFGPADLGYWLGLHQAQSMAPLANMPVAHQLAAMPIWQNPFAAPTSVSAGGPDSLSWLYA